MNRITALIAIAVLTISCGGGTTGSSTAPHRTVTGTLSGDLSNFSGVRAVRNDGAAYNAILAIPRAGALVAEPVLYTFDLPINYRYTISVVSTAGNAAAILVYPKSDGSTTSMFAVSFDTASVDLGDATLPAGTGAEGSNVAQITPENNPLLQNDMDYDGISDYEDNSLDDYDEFPFDFGDGGDGIFDGDFWLR